MPAPLLAFGALNGAALEMLDPERVQAALPPRTPQMHKGEAGRVLVVAGSPPMPGAAALCAMASLRSGAGLAYLASYPEVARAAAARYSEIVMVPPGETLERAASADCVVAGPGMGNSARTREMIRLLLEEGIGATLVLDADALNCLEGRAHLLAAAARRGARLVLTPHPGELARLMGCSVREIQSDRVSWAVSAAGATGALEILKGARTLVAAPDGRLAVNPPKQRMATAGSDVLAGVVAAMCAQIACALRCRVRRSLLPRPCRRHRRRAPRRAGDHRRRRAGMPARRLRRGGRPSGRALEEHAVRAHERVRKMVILA